MELRRPRFTVIALMGLVAACGIAMAVVVNLPFEAVWVGSASIPLDFVVVDAASGKPVNGATIRLTESSPEYCTVTGRDGRAEILIDAMTGGRSSWRRETRSVNYSWGLSIACDRYEDVNAGLRELTQAPSYHSGKTPPPIVIRLKPKVLAEEPATR